FLLLNLLHNVSLNKNKKLASLVLAHALVIGFSLPVKSEEVPLWEIDGNLSAISLDAYPGSSYNRTIVFPFPNFRLNSPYLQSSGGGVNARILNSEKLDIGLSMSGSLPTKNKHLEVRQERNMPD